MTPLTRLAPFVLGTTALACSPSASLEPANPHATAPGMENGSQDEGTRLVVAAGAEEWPGEARIDQAVTPLQVELTNHSAENVAIRHQDITLVDDRGREYHVLPPLSIQGEVDLAVAYASEAPSLQHRGFYATAPYATRLPTMSPFDGRVVRDKNYNTVFYAGWDVHEALPTPEMISAAIPEGVLEPYGQVSGWLFFEKVEDDAETVTFHVDAHDPDASLLEEITIPFIRT